MTKQKDKIIQIIENYPIKRNPRSLLFQDCPSCNKKINRSFVDKTLIEVENDFKQGIIRLLKEKLS